jgi:hypothetical protein
MPQGSPKTGAFRRRRKNRKHDLAYYLMCGAPMDPLAHIEQLFAEGEPLWTAQFRAAPGARKPAADEQGGRAPRRVAGSRHWPEHESPPGRGHSKYCRISSMSAA